MALASEQKKNDDGMIEVPAEAGEASLPSHQGKHMILHAGRGASKSILSFLRRNPFLLRILALLWVERKRQQCSGRLVAPNDNTGQSSRLFSKLDTATASKLTLLVIAATPSLREWLQKVLKSASNDKYALSGLLLARGSLETVNLISQWSFLLGLSSVVYKRNRTSSQLVKRISHGAGGMLTASLFTFVTVEFAKKMTHLLLQGHRQLVQQQDNDNADDETPGSEHRSIASEISIVSERNQKELTAIPFMEWIKAGGSTFHTIFQQALLYEAFPKKVPESQHLHQEATFASKAADREIPAVVVTTKSPLTQDSNVNVKPDTACYNNGLEEKAKLSSNSKKKNAETPSLDASDSSSAAAEAAEVTLDTIELTHCETPVKTERGIENLEPRSAALDHETPVNNCSMNNNRSSNNNVMKEEDRPAKYLSGSFQTKPMDISGDLTEITMFCETPMKEPSDDKLKTPPTKLLMDPDMSLETSTAEENLFKDTTKGLPSPVKLHKEMQNSLASSTDKIPLRMESNSSLDVALDNGCSSSFLNTASSVAWFLLVRLPLKIAYIAILWTCVVCFVFFTWPLLVDDNGAEELGALRTPSLPP